MKQTEPPGGSEIAAWPAWCRRVVIVAPRYPEASGGSRYVDNLGLALSEIGVDVSVISIGPGTAVPALPTSVVITHQSLHRHPVIRGERTMGARVAAVPRYIFKQWDRHRYRRWLRHRMAACGSDTAVIFTHAIAKLTLDETGFRTSSSHAMFIGQHHSAFESLDREPGLRAQILRAFGDVNAFTALSPEDAERFAALLPVPCFSVDNICGPAPSIRSETRTRKRAAVALVRLSPEKRVDLMIRAFVRATSTPPLQDWQLDIYGEGEQRGELEELIDSVDARDRVHLHGVTSDAAGRLGEASLNLLTSEYEGFGYSVLEAAQAGTPSLAFDCSPGLRGLMQNVHGRLVTTELGETGYANALRELLGAPDLVEQLGRSARKGAELYRPERVLPQWFRILRELRADAISRSATSQPIVRPSIALNSDRASRIAREPR